MADFVNLQEGQAAIPGTRYRFIESFDPVLDGASSKAERINEQISREDGKFHYLLESTSPAKDRIAKLIEKGVNVYDMAVSKYDYLNGNKRKYPRKLWENVIKNQRQLWERRTGLADHPADNDEGRFRDSSVVWHDLYLTNEGIVRGVCSFVGPYGKLAEDILNVDGLVPFSSSGFGELMPDGCTVNPDTFEIERVADLVLTPSQGVFGDASNKLMPTTPIQPSAQVAPESPVANAIDSGVAAVAQDANNMQNYAANGMNTGNGNIQPSILSGSPYTEGTKKGTSMAQKTLAPIEERKFRRDITTYLSEAEAIDNPKNRLASLEEVLGYFNDMPECVNDLKEKVVNSINVAKDLIEKYIEQATCIAKEVEEEKDEDEELEEGKEIISTYNSVKEKNEFISQSVEEWALIAEKLQKKVIEQKAIIASMPSASILVEMEDKVKKIVENKNKVISEKDQTILNLKKQLENEKGVSEQYAAQLDEMIKISKELDAVLEGYKRQNVELSSQFAALSEAFTSTKAQYEMQIQDMKEAINPTLADKPSRIREALGGFNESDQVLNYWKVLVGKFGPKIKIYENEILSSKTLADAKDKFYAILPNMDESINNMTVPSSVAFTQSDRVALLESKGVKIDPNANNGSFSKLIKKFEDQ